MEEKELIVKSVGEMYDEVKKSEGKVIFTKEEAQILLDIMIEDQCEWSLRKFYPKSYNSSMLEVAYPSMNTETKTAPEPPTEEDINKIVDSVYKYIVKEWRYNTVTLDICRKAKFNRSMVADIVLACQNKMAVENGEVGKSLGRSLQRVIESGVDISKAVEYDSIVKSGVARPERIYTFLSTIKK